jgi:DNA-directed RNA polymerase subunit E'/Rpb7
MCTYPQVGDIVSGVVQRVTSYGAFVELDGFWGEDGQPAGVVKSERALLETIASGRSALDPEGTAWVWIFVQLRNDAAGSERAPVVAPR